MEVIAALMNKIDSWIWGLPTLDEARAERHKNMRTAQQHQHGQTPDPAVDFVH